MALGHGPSFNLANLVFMSDFQNPRCAVYDAVVKTPINDLSTNRRLLPVTFTSGGWTWFLDDNGNLLTVAISGAGPNYWSVSSIPTYSVSPLTVVAWVNPNAVTTTQTIFAHPISTLTNGGWRMVLRLDKLGFSLNASPSALDYTSTSATIKANAWQMVSVTISDTTLSFWLNGIRYDSTTIGTVSGSPAAFMIGRDPSGSQYSGGLGPIIMFNSVLTDAEMAGVYNAYRSRLGLS